MISWTHKHRKTLSTSCAFPPIINIKRLKTKVFMDIQLPDG